MQDPRSSARRTRLIVGLLGLGPLALLGLVVASILVFPTWLHPPLTEQELAGITGKDRLAAQDARRQRQDAARATLLQGAGALLVFTSAGLGAYFTWRQLHTARQGQVTERFTRAIDQLGADQLDIRLGGIYALERIARDSEGDRATIGEVLTAYVRTHSPWPPRLPGQGRADLTLDQLRELPSLRTRMPDVQAALTVLGRSLFAGRRFRYAEWVVARLDLGATDLRRSNLDFAYLEFASFAGAHLERANLEGARLAGAYLDGAYLEGADLRSVGLRESNLVGAHLNGADLRSADLTESKLDGAHLEGAVAVPWTRWPDGFDWQAAGVILVNKYTGEPVPAEPGADNGDLAAGGNAQPDA